MGDLEACVQVGELQDHLSCDVIPGDCRRSPVQQVQTGVVQTEAWGWEGQRAETAWLETPPPYGHRSRYAPWPPLTCDARGQRQLHGDRSEEAGGTAL